MGHIALQYVGDMQAPRSDTAIEVGSDIDYVLACKTSLSTLRSGASLEIRVRTRHHFAWLEDFFTQLGVDVQISEKTARSMLAETWSTRIPDWVTDQDIIDQNLLTLEGKGGGGKTFEALLASSLLGFDLRGDTLSEESFGRLITALTGEAYPSVKKHYPMVEEALKRLASRWSASAGDRWTASLCKHIPEDVETLWTLVSASCLLGSYPKELLDRVLPVGQASLARRIPRSICSDIPLEPAAREEAVTQIELLFKDLEAKVGSSEEFRKIVSWVSGKTVEEYRLVEKLLKSGRFEPKDQDVRAVQAAFEACPEVRRSRLESLRHVIRPAYPRLLSGNETWEGSRWMQWAVEEYMPYRHWQIRNNAYDGALEETVVRFSDWYLRNYPAIQAHPQYGLIHALNTVHGDSDEDGLTVVLMIDCLPVMFADTLDHALRGAGFRQHRLEYRYAALPTVTGYNKAAVISGRPGRTDESYAKLLSDRSQRDWNGVPTRYITTVKELSELDPGSEASVILVNHLEGDDLLHSDVESKNRTYEEELGRSYAQLAEALSDMCNRWSGPREHLSILVVTDHGACRVLEEERKSFDSAVIGKLFSDDKHRVATMTTDQADNVPSNLWDIGYRFSEPFGKDDIVHFLPRGHNTVRKAGAGKGYIHGGVSPEEVIVPCARYGLVSIAAKKPFIQVLNLDMTPDESKARFYIQRVVRIEVEIQNPNATTLYSRALEVVSPDTAVKGVGLNDVAAGSVTTLTMDLYFRKSAQDESSLELKFRYAVGGDDYEQIITVPAEFKSAMSGGFSLKDL